VRISLVVALGYLAVVTLAVAFVLRVLVQEVKPGVRQAMEDTLVDSANLLAELVQPELASGHLEQGRFAQALARYRQRAVDAGIWDIRKTQLDYRVYVTDAGGQVLASTDPTEVGRDYSQWRDVYLTLRHRYGARSTRSDPADPRTSVMHVAAPVLSDGRVIGVVSVAKPGLSVQPFIERSQARLRTQGLLLVLVTGLMGALFAWRLTRSIGRLSRYAREVAQGHRSTPPRSSSRELAELGRALHAMRERLEGKQYVERYVHTLTHELKGPLAAIRGAAELLAESDVPAEERQRFLANIGEQEERLRLVADKMLELARVEQQQALDNASVIDLAAVARAVVESHAATARTGEVALHLSLADAGAVRGDEFLLRQTLSNLVDNALAFSPAGATVDLRIERSEGWVRAQVCDRGPGIPNYAAARVFERFYSLPRPGTGKKSTGLGLTFVREVAELHGGRISLNNRDGGGTCASLQLPSAG